MICVKIQAGFGNQLFQFAMGYSLSRKTGQPLLLDISFNKYHQLKGKIGIKTPEMFQKCYLEYLQIDNNWFIGNPLRNWTQFTKRKLGLSTIRINGKKIPMRVENFDGCREYQENLVTDIPEIGVYLEGFWQNYKYFEEFQKELQEIFRPNYFFDKEVSSWMHEIIGGNSVGIHIRRGDFVKLGWSQGIDFYLKGIERIQKELINCQFFVFTDDKKWAKEKLMRISNLKIVEIKSDLQDLDEFFLLKECKHHIISESTYGWWAAYLNPNPNKVVIVPDKAVGNLFMDEWIRI